MTIVRRPSPMRDMLTMRHAMDRFFDDDFRPFRWLAGGFDGPALPLDVTTDADSVTIEAALPGIEPDDVDITVENGTVTISGKTADERPCKTIENPVNIENLHATIYRAVGIPADLAYGSRGAGSVIGPGEALVFVVDLVSVNQ